MTSSDTIEKVARQPDEAVLREMRRINDVCHPTYAQGDREDLITYAKEVVKLRAAISAYEQSGGWTGDAAKRTLDLADNPPAMRSAIGKGAENSGIHKQT